VISVIIPAYNAQSTLPDCLRALQSQETREPFEVIVVDDGSTDGTGERAGELGARIIRQTWQGPAAARNLGLGAATGEVVLFTDADCVPAPDWVEQMVAPLRDPQVAGVKGVYGTWQCSIVARLAQIEFEERYDRLERSHFVDFFDSYALALRTATLQALGSFDTFFPAANNEDVDLAYRLADSGCHLVFNRRARVFHRHPVSWGQYGRQKFWRGYWRMQVYHRFPHKMVSDSYTPQSLKAQIGLVGLACILSPLVVMRWLPAWSVALLLALAMLAGWRLFRLASKRDRALLTFMPLFITLRAIAVGLGVIIGMLTILHLVPLLKPRSHAPPQPSLERA
jgi:glycosyltransferase involved in cell wall biosynthesis